MSLDDVANMTRIRPLMIEAIEDDDFSLCGGVTYAKGQVRSIAACVGLDPDDVVAEFGRNGSRSEVGAIPEEIEEPAAVERRLAKRTARRWVFLAVAVVVVVVGVVLWRALGS